MIPVVGPNPPLQCSEPPEGRPAGSRACSLPSNKLEGMLGRSQRLETLGRMTGAIAHDFNNLLLIVFGATELARIATRDPRVEVELGRIEEASVRAAGLVRQLLDFARGKPAEVKVLRLGEVVSHMVRLLDLSLGAGTELVISVDEGLWPVLADSSQIEQLVLNLAINARDAMPEGGKVLLELRNVEASPEHAPLEDHVCLRFRDTGLGMDAETLARVFELFFTTKQSGTGLGLATCQRIVQRAGGTIVATSAPGVGTEFVVRLPVPFRPSSGADRGARYVEKR